MRNATQLRPHALSSELPLRRTQEWAAVRAHPLLVLSLRNPAGPETRLDTWRSLTALFFACGLATRQTRAIEVHYDVPALGRFDACLSMPSPQVAAGVTEEDLAQVPGIRFETVMGHGPFLHRKPAPAESRHEQLMSKASLPPGCSHSASHVPAWPHYHLYGCSPILAAGASAVTDIYVSLKPAASGRSGPARL